MALLKCSAGTCGGHEIVRSKTGNEGRAALNKLPTFGFIYSYFGRGDVIRVGEGDVHFS